MTLPLLLSVPHAGLAVPPEAVSYCVLTHREISEDGDEGAAEIYLGLEPLVAAFHTTDIARAIVDMNRAEDDRRRDGAIKTHTCWNVPVYRTPLPDAVAEGLIGRYHRPYHRRLAELAAEGAARLAIDCHTMAAQGPPVGPDTGRERPWICLGYGDGACPRDWIEALKACFEALIGPNVTIDDPFSGGYITRCHSAEMPWLQLEMSRAPFRSDAEKSRLVRAALVALAANLGWD
ncbi:MAG: N-formylglutamate amidohydrolase [Rhodospirillaceae bacterium]|nr:N-formylglutamate amidohydrolase [Rhodospirillaceae bacterium]